MPTGMPDLLFTCYLLSLPHVRLAVSRWTGKHMADAPADVHMVIKRSCASRATSQIRKWHNC